MSLSMCSPNLSQNKTMVKTRTDTQEGGTTSIPSNSTWTKGWLQNREVHGSISPESLELREGTEKGGKQPMWVAGDSWGVWSSCPHLLNGLGGSRVGGVASCEAPLPLRRGCSPLDCSDNEDGKSIKHQLHVLGVGGAGEVCTGHLGILALA